MYVCMCVCMYPGPSDSQNNSNKISLAIYPPRVGVLQVWALPHGPCLYSIPVGLNAHLLTLHSTSSLNRFYGMSNMLQEGFVIFNTRTLHKSRNNYQSA